LERTTNKNKASSESWIGFLVVFIKLGELILNILFLDFNLLLNKKKVFWVNTSIFNPSYLQLMEVQIFLFKSEKELL